MADPAYLFVYGSLRRGFRGHGLLGAAPCVGEGWIRGRLFDMGAWPAAVMAEAAGDGREDTDDDARIRGEVYGLPADGGALLDTLDAYEGYVPERPATSLFVRVPADVAMDDGTAVRAWTYRYVSSTGRFPRVPSGDWTRRAP